MASEGTSKKRTFHEEAVQSPQNPPSSSSNSKRDPPDITRSKITSCIDPLTWPLPLKISVLIQVSLLSALGGLNTAIINPAYVPLAQDFGISSTTASYQTTVCIALNGIGPFLWVPLSNKFGRRPILLGTTLLGFASALGSAYSRNFGQLLLARVFNGFFPAAFSLGASVVVDVFFLEQRGRAMGMFTVLSVNGSHIAPLVGGPLGQFLGWRWCFKFAAVCNAVMLAVVFFAFPETLHVPASKGADAERQQNGEIGTGLTSKSYLKQLKLHSHNPSVRLRWKQFVLPSLKMARYPSVLFPALYFGTQYGFASILPAVTVAPIFSEVYDWNTLEIGLGYGAALTIGGSLGELAAGMVLDGIVKKEIKKRNGKAPPPEVRLKAIWTGEIFVPIGLLIYGFTMQYRTHWMGPLFGMGKWRSLS